MNLHAAGERAFHKERDFLRRLGNITFLDGEVRGLPSWPATGDKRKPGSCRFVWLDKAPNRPVL
ncbi:MAG: hypothetical protein M3R67_10575, partial [Acidobacteriota bacterium]|nr:hypothetical protein [Acidobacteriota bacterium]